MSIYTAGIPAEYGRKMGGVVEVNTIADTKPGMHGKVVLSGGSFDTAGAFAKAQYAWGQKYAGRQCRRRMTDHYLNPVVPQNYTNTGTAGDFVDFVSARSYCQRPVRHECPPRAARFHIPNEQVQQERGPAADGRQFRNDRHGLLSAHIFCKHGRRSSRHGSRQCERFLFQRGIDANRFVQHNWFREGYFRGSHHRFVHRQQEWKLGVESDNTFLHEDFHY